MIDITLRCYALPGNRLLIKEDVETGGIQVVRVAQNGSSVHIWLTSDDTRRLYDALGAHLGITPPAEPDALTRIAVASERTADALEKLASYATEDGLAESTRIP